jgi:hypothetical protein
MSIVGGFDVHRQQITFDYVDTDTGELRRGQIRPAARLVLRQWLGERFGPAPGVLVAARGDLSFGLQDPPSRSRHQRPTTPGWSRAGTTMRLLRRASSQAGVVAAAAVTAGANSRAHSSGTKCPPSTCCSRTSAKN